MHYPVYFVNAFADRYYQGNTAAVVLLEDYPPEAKMLALAKEFAFSETAFLRQLSSSEYQIRWFTPEVEVPLCGHATLASAKALFSSREAAADQIRFQSLSGELIASRFAERIELDFPAEPSVAHALDPEVLQAIGSVPPEEVLSARASRNLILVYARPELITALEPDFPRLAAFQDLPYFGIAVTAPAPEGYICRYFAPWEGINEDPVTGSAQTYLAPYWAQRLGQNLLQGYQASKRGGAFEVEVLPERVLIRGRAFIYLSGELAPGWMD